MGNFDGALAVVTGAGSGIGHATARLLAENGAHVIATDINRAAAESVAEEIASQGGTATAYQLDVADAEAISAFFDTIEDQFGTATVLINCAGILHIAPALETTIDDFDRVITVNLRSIFATSVTFAQRLVAAKAAGSIVNITSVHAAVSEPNASAYTAAKGGVEAMSRTFASEWAKHGIRVNCVRPGATRTALTDELYTPAVLRALEARVPLKRPAAPEEIANAIVYLASPQASYTTGATLDVDGGYRMDGSLPNTEYK